MLIPLSILLQMSTVLPASPCKMAFLTKLEIMILHGEAGKTVDICIEEHTVTIKNHGTNSALNSDNLFKRFKKSSADSRSTGLGLAISKAIADKYHLQLQYSFDGQHMFTLIFP